MSGTTTSRALVIAVSGLRVEARIAARSEGVRALAGGGDAERLTGLIEAAIGEGASALISFGVAAGLAPALNAGDCVIGSEVVQGESRHPADQAWTGRLAHTLEVKPAPVAGVDRPLRSVAEKRALHEATGAVAADMESHIVAALAARHGLPFAVLRVIADPTTREIPEAAMAGMREDGSVDALAVIGALARRPQDLPKLMRLAGDMRAAMAGLLRCHDRLGGLGGLGLGGPGLGGPNLG